MEQRGDEVVTVALSTWNREYYEVRLGFVTVIRIATFSRESNGASKEDNDNLPRQNCSYTHWKSIIPQSFIGKIQLNLTMVIFLAIIVRSYNKSVIIKHV